MTYSTIIAYAKKIGGTYRFRRDVPGVKLGLYVTHPRGDTLFAGQELYMRGVNA